MTLYNEKYKVMHLILNNKKTLLPVIYHSYLYSLWILSHKYKDMILLDITTTTEFPTKFTTNTNPINFTIPHKTPSELLDITNDIEVIKYLGVDECLLLNNFSKFDEIVDLIKNNKVTNTKSLTTRYTLYFDLALINIHVNSKTLERGKITYRNAVMYKLSATTRRGYNRLVERVRQSLRKSPNKIINKHINKYQLKLLSNSERDYMESQLQEFFRLLHERLINE